MEPTTILNLALLLVTGIGVLVAILSAVDARRSRDQAGIYEKAALKSKDEAIVAAKRSADALERQADAAEATLEKEPWQIYRASEHRWKVTNNTGNAINYVRIQGKPAGHLTVEGQSEGAFFDLGKGASVFIQFGGGVVDPSSLHVTIDWRSVEGTGESTAFTLP